jgi:tripartite-type tricarboxylate transporter receptor subunit TctC
VVQWTGVFAPAKTPRPIVDRLGQEITRLVNTPEFAAVIQQHGNEPAPMTPDELGGYLRREIDKWAKVVKATGVKVD